MIFFTWAIVEALQLKVRQSLLATLALIVVRSMYRVTHVQVQRGGAAEPEYPYAAQAKRTN